MAVSSSPIQDYDEVDITFLCLFFVLVYDMSIREEGRINLLMIGLKLDLDLQCTCRVSYRWSNASDAPADEYNGCY